MIQSCCGWLALALQLTMKIFLLLVIALCWGLPGDENEERNYDEYSPGDTEKDEYVDQNEDVSEEYKEAYSLG